MTDRDMIAHRLRVATVEAQAAYRSADAAPFAPKMALADEWREFSEKFAAAPDDDCKIAVAREAKAHFERRAQRVGVLKPYLDEFQRDQDRQRGLHARAAADAQTAHIARAAANMPKFDPIAALRKLGERHISVAVDGDAIVARPAALLTDADRRMLRDNRGAFIDALAGEKF